MVIPSLFTGATALTTMQQGIAVIANNIANVNTTAFKASRVHYGDQTYYNVKFASSPTTTRGGANPGQVGTGIKLADVNTIHTQGSLKNTGLAPDLAISGEGYFVITDELTADISSTNNTSTFDGHYTRNGHFLVDADRNLVTSDGAFVMGAMLYETASGRIKSTEGYQNITYYTDQSVGDINNPDYLATDGIGANLAVPIPAVANTSLIGSAPVFRDDLVAEISVRGGVIDNAIGIATGAGLVGDLEISRQADGKMLFVFDDSNLGTAASLFSASFDTTQQILNNVQTVELQNQNGETIQLRIRLEHGVGSFSDVFEDINYDAVLGSDTMRFSGADPSTQADTVMTVGDDDYRFLTVTQLADLSDSIEIPNFFYAQDPLLEVETVNYSIESDGTINIFGPGSEVINLGRILMANFTNQDGLISKGNTRFEESSNSGPAALTVIGGPFNRSAPSLRGTSIVSGALETANVNLAEEFAELIQQQRGLQAQSRTITTSDEILQTIINL